MAAPPRVAVVGGGISGSLAALGLRGRGVIPVIFDSGKRFGGGRLGGQSSSNATAATNGAQFFRATPHSRFERVLKLLQRHNLVSPWEDCEHGVLGARGGNYLSKQFVPKKLPKRNTSFDESNHHDHHPPTTTTQWDSGDFCGFIEGDGPLYVGTPSNAAVCDGICRLVGAEQVSATVSAVQYDSDSQKGGTWLVETTDSPLNDEFDAVVLAVHDPSFAAAAVSKLETDDPAVRDRLLDLTNELERLRHEARVPLMTLTASFAPETLKENAPFDAATIHGSDILQFLAREASKPGRVPQQEEWWTAVSTSNFARKHLDMNSEEGAISTEMTSELVRLLGPHISSSSGEVLTPLHASIYRWSAAFTDGAALEKWSRMEEDCVALEPWRLSICGDFLRRQHACPIESAALSGLEAGDRVGAWLS